jgi:tetratricopeptide (TPR) repeat protein
MAKMDKYTAPRGGATQQTVQRIEEASGAEPIASAEEKFERIESAFQSNRKPIMIGLGLLVALPLLYFAYTKVIAGPKENKAADALGKISTYMLLDSTSAMISGVGKTEGVAKIANNYSGTDAGNVATYMLGAGYLKQGKFKEAITALEKFDGKGTLLEGIATGLLGDAYWENNQLDKATECYEKAAKDDKNMQFSPEYLKRAATIYEIQNKSDKAIAAYKAIRTKFPQSRLSLEADKALAKLGVTTND